MATASDPAKVHKATEATRAQELKRSALALSLGSAIEYYDFALYSLASALILGPLFFPDKSHSLELILSFATYFIGFAARPFGGIVFGALGDKLGRKVVLVVTILLMGLSSTLIGLLPTYQDVGPLAPVLLIILRMTQGLGAGAEQAGAAVMMTESAPAHRRGFFASLPFLGVQGGTVAAAIIYFVFLHGTDNTTDGLMWRIPFLISAILVCFALYLRLRMKESPTFTKLSAEQVPIKSPLRACFQKSRRSILTGIGLRMGENGGSSIYQALAISYVADVVGEKGPLGALTLVVAGIVGAFTVVIAGKASDIYGRRAVYRFFAVFQLIIALPVWWVLSQGNIVTTIIAITIALGIGTWGMFGTQGALMPELFGSRYRYIGVSVSREVSSLIAGGIAPLIGALLISGTTAVLGHAQGMAVYAWVPIALYLMLITGITVFTTWKMPETLNRDLETPKDAYAES